jgi:hypothetical protein
MAEQVTLNHWVRGSNPWRRTISPGQGVTALSRHRAPVCYRFANSTAHAPHTALEDTSTARPSSSGMASAYTFSVTLGSLWPRRLATTCTGTPSRRRVEAWECRTWCSTSLGTSALRAVSAPAGDDYILDWSEQETAERVQERKAFNSERQRRFRDWSERHARGDHSACDPRFCKSAVTRYVTHQMTRQ